MWSYYGSKANIVHLYPPPKYGRIIEPFAGSARYALRYWDREVLLVDKYEVIIKIWKWLQLCSPGDITKLPRLKAGQTLNDFTFDCEEQKLLLGFIVQFGVATPGITPSASKINPGSHSRGNYMNYTLLRIAKDLYKIKDWCIVLGSYESIGNECATWFIDPPYQSGGHKYKFGNKDIDFVELAKWVNEREGQKIVCENERATWLNFNSLSRQQGTAGIKHEVFWTNEPTSYKPAPKPLF